MIVPKDAKPLAQTIENLSGYIGEPAESFMAKIEERKGARPYQPILLKKDVDRDLLATLEAHKYDLPGINVHVRPIRNYVGGHLATHLIGYLSEINADELASDKYSANRPGDLPNQLALRDRSNHRHLPNFRRMMISFPEERRQSQLLTTFSG